MRISLRGIYRNPGFRPISIVAIISILLIVIPNSIKTSISRFAAVSILYPFVEIDRFLLKVDSTFEINRHLNRRLDFLSTTLSTVIENRYENERLRKMLGFDLMLPYELKPAEVIAYSPTARFKSILINAGTGKGIDRNMPVISPSGVVGKTVSAENNSAVVQLLFDPSCKVAARLQNSRAQGIVAFLGGHLLSLTNVPADQIVSVGDSVISSGLGGIFPEGLYIGRITDTRVKEGEMFYQIDIEPGANFSLLEEVFVITSIPGGY
jgi:rod shape-determining protein MreC